MPLVVDPPNAAGILGLEEIPFPPKYQGDGVNGGGPILPADEKALVEVWKSLQAAIVPTNVPVALAGLWLNPTAGSDANDGLTQATAFKTYAKVVSVLGYAPVFRANFTLHVDGPGPLTDDLVGTWTAAKTGIVLAVEFTEANSGAPSVLTGVTNRVQATNTRQAITDGATVWTANLKKIIRDDTVGARFGTKSFLMSNNGGGAATVGTWLLTDESAIVVAPVETRPLVGDSIQVIDSFPVTGNISLCVTGIGGSKFFLRGAHLSCAQSFSINNPDGVMRAYVVDCVQDCAFVTRNIQHVNVVYKQPVAAVVAPGGAPVSLYGGGFVDAVNGLTFRRGVSVSIELGLAGMTSGFIVTDNGTMATVLDMAIYSIAAGVCLTVADGAYVKFGNAAALWGANAAAANIMALVGGSTAEIPVASTWTLTIPATAIAEFTDGTGALGFPFNVGTRVYDAAITINKANLDGTFPNLRYISPINGNRFMTG